MDPENLETLFQNLQKQVKEENNEPSVVFHKEEESKTVEQVNMREELTNLAKNGKIKYSAQYIKKASIPALEKIKETYEKNQLEETNNYITDIIISSVDKLLKYFELVKNTDEMKKHLLQG